MESSFEPEREGNDPEQPNNNTNINLEDEVSPDVAPQGQIPHDDSDQDDRRAPIPLVRSPFGNLKVIKSDFPHLSLGPDYCCFIFAFLAFAVTSYYLIVLVLTSTDSWLFHFVTIVICVGQPLSYLLVALSDPGVVRSSISDEGTGRDCNRCGLIVPRHARHCRDCNVCVGDYDHHCPWTSKCIGGKNLVKFYVFLGLTPTYLIYITIAFVVCMSNNLAKVQHLKKT